MYQQSETTIDYIHSNASSFTEYLTCVYLYYRILLLYSCPYVVTKVSSAKPILTCAAFFFTTYHILSKIVTAIVWSLTFSNNHPATTT